MEWFIGYDVKNYACHWTAEVQWTFLNGDLNKHDDVCTPDEHNQWANACIIIVS